MILVSACLAGFRTRYDGTDCLNPEVKKLVAEGGAVPVCPEQLGGLPTPRMPVEFTAGDGRDVLEGKARAASPLTGEDFTGAFIKGAAEVLRIARLYGATGAILKDGSPSCGTTRVHSAGEERPGMGVTAALLQKEGIEVRPGDTL